MLQETKQFSLQLILEIQQKNQELICKYNPDLSRLRLKRNQIIDRKGTNKRIRNTSNGEKMQWEGVTYEKL